MMGRQSILAGVLLLMTSAPALSQTPAASFEELIAAGAIQPRQSVYVTDAWGQRIKGTLGELRPGTLVLTKGSERIPMTEATRQPDSASRFDPERPVARLRRRRCRGVGRPSLLL